MTWAEKLRWARTTLDLEQTDIGKRFGWSLRKVVYLEGGRRQPDRGDQRLIEDLFLEAKAATEPAGAGKGGAS